jgi:AAA domain/RepB DNA-primase N-terminal domain
VKGELTPDQQLAVLGRIWGNDRDGYVFLPTIDGSARDAAARRKGYHEGRAFEWPREKDKIRERLEAHSADDMYFTPALFNAKRRSEHVVEAERTLWADLDPVDPESLVDYRPTIAWETSPGRYQAVWLLDRPRVGASWASKENHRLTLHIGADPGGWDATQLLRVPGRPNHKPDYGDSPVPGRLLWDAGPRYSWEDFDDLPEVGVLHEEVDLLDEELLSGIDRHEVWARVRLKVSRNVREYVAQRRVPEDVDRSEVLWQIERELADAGCSVAEIVAVVRQTVWNKYEGRQDELRRLKTEAAKAVGSREESPLERTEDDVGDLLEDANWWDDEDARPTPRPRWIVEGIWAEGACGFIAGDPKSYKSYLALDLAVSVASGGEWLGLRQHRVKRARRVLYLQEEDGRPLVKDRLRSVSEARSPRLFRAGILSLEPPSPVGDTAPILDTSVRSPRKSVVWTPPEGRLPVAVHIQSGFVASDPLHQGRLRDFIERHEIDFVVIDTLGTVAGDLDTDRASELMAKLLKPLKTIAQETETAICLVHHNRKSQADRNGRAGSEMLGSVSLYAWVDCGIYVKAADRPEPDGSKIVSILGQSKQDTEVTLKIAVPKMYADVRTGERRLWDPEVVVEAQEPGPTPTQQGPPTSTKETRGRGARVIMAKGLRLDRGPRPVEAVEEAMGPKETARWVKQGYLVREGDRYRWTEVPAAGAAT